MEQITYMMVACSASDCDLVSQWFVGRRCVIMSQLWSQLWSQPLLTYNDCSAGYESLLSRLPLIFPLIFPLTLAFWMPLPHAQNQTQTDSPAL